MINRVVLVGRLTKDPELRTGATSGKSIVSFTIAVNGRGKNPDGTRPTSYITCVAFGQTAETLSKYTRKGSLVGVEGALNQRKYERQDKSVASVIEVLCDSVQFLEAKGARDVVPEFDSVAPAGEEVEEVEDESRNLSAIDLPDSDLPF